MFQEDVTVRDSCSSVEESAEAVRQGFNLTHVSHLLGELAFKLVLVKKYGA